MSSNQGAYGVRTRRLTEISRALTYARSLQEVLDLTVDCARDLLVASRVVLMLNGPDGLLRIRAARGMDPVVVQRFSEPLNENLLERLTGVLGPTVADDFLGVPLVIRGQVIGLLGVLLERAELSAEDAEWLLSALADQASVALESTRHEELRNALEIRVDELEESQGRKERAFQILSHDLRSPLNAIQGYVTLLSGGVLGPVTERQREALQRISRVGDHLLAILSDVLDMARISGAGLTLDPKPVAIRDVVADAVSIVRPAAEAASIAFETEGSDDTRITTDVNRFRQVLVQLLDNAVKYGPDASTVRVGWQCVEADGRPWMQIAVEDQGEGIPPERQQSIFEPYSRKDGSTERARSGVGLGLAIARGLVERLGGTLTVESEPGEGATFLVRLPVDGPDGASDGS